MKVVICGLASNCADPMLTALKQLLSCFARDEIIAVHIVESDSRDETVSYLKRIEQDNDFFSFSALGTLADKLPNRVGRIHHCRQQYISWLRENCILSNCDIVMIVDFDITFNQLNRERLDLLIRPVRSGQFEAVFPNTKELYYDLYALRCHGWVMSDIWKDVERFKRYMDYEKCLEAFVYSKQINLKGKGYLPVDSAFGGLGVYTAETFDTCCYGNDFPKTCEHVGLHKNMKLKHSAELAISLDADLIVSPVEHLK